MTTSISPDSLNTSSLSSCKIRKKVIQRTYKVIQKAAGDRCLFDEEYYTTNFYPPTGNLDSKTSADVLGLLKRTSTEFNQTIVMITHNNEIAQLADRIVRIEDGRIVQ